MTNSEAYVEKYYDLYASAELDQEMETTGLFLAENVQGITLDCGCGPVPQLWSIFMPNLAELHAVDLPQESINFVQEKLKIVHEWQATFFAVPESYREKARYAWQ